MLPDEVVLFNKEHSVNHRLPDVLMLCEHGINKILRDNGITTIREITNDAVQRDIRSTFTYKGRHLYEMGILDIFKDIFSKECLNFMRQHEGQYALISDNPRASEFMCRLAKLLYVFKWNIFYVGEGMNAITDKLHEKIRDKVDVRFKCSLESIRRSKTQKDRYELVFASGLVVTCKHVILTIPPENLCEVKGIPMRITEMVKSSLQSVRLFKVFVIVENPPWGGIADHMTDIEHLQPITDSSRSEGVVVFYTDHPNLAQEPQTDQKEMSILLRGQVAETLRTMYPDDKQWKIKVVEMSDWYAKPELQLFVWRSGVEPHLVMDDLTAFSIDKKERQAHVCGEAFSDNQCFMEGAISSAEKVVRRVSLDLDIKLNLDLNPDHSGSNAKKIV